MHCLVDFGFARTGVGLYIMPKKFRTWIGAVKRCLAYLPAQVASPHLLMAILFDKQPDVSDTWALMHGQYSKQFQLGQLNKFELY